MGKSTRTHTVDLTTERTDGGKQLKIDSHVFEVTRLDDEASIRIGDQDARPTQLGDTDRFVSEDGDPFDRVWIDNPASDVAGAELEITIPSGYCRERSASGRVRVVKAGPSASFDPTRLQDALAATTTIASGEEASEEVDVSGATALRVRAQVSGTSAWAHRNTVTHADMVQPTAVAADPSGERVWVACHDGATTTKLTEWDVSNPDAPTRTATLDDAELEDVEQLAYDADNDLLIAVTSASTPKLVVIDTSTPGTPSKSGSVAISSSDPEVLVLDPAVSQAYVSGLFGGTTCSVDYSTPATPAEQDTTTDAVGPIALGENGDVLHIHHRTGTASSRDDYKAVDVRDPSSIALIDAVDLTADITVKHGIAFDADRDLFFLLGQHGTGTVVGVFDVSNPFAAKLLAEHDGVLPDSVISNVTGIFYDDTSNLLYVQDGNDIAVVNLADELNPVLVVRLNTTDLSNISGFNRFAHLGDFETWFVTNDGDGELNTLAWIPGADQLRLWTKNPGGGRSSSLMPAALDLPDSEEAGVEFDVQGESTVEVEVAARSEKDTTVDYVDVYRATG